MESFNSPVEIQQAGGRYVSWSSFCAKNKTKTSKYRHGNMDSFSIGNLRLSFSLLFFVFSLKQTHLLTQMFFCSSLTRITPLHRLIRLLPHAELLLPSTILRTVNGDGACLLEYAAPVCRCTYMCLLKIGGKQTGGEQKWDWQRKKNDRHKVRKWQRCKKAHIQTHLPRILWGCFVLGQSCVIKVRSHNHFDYSGKPDQLKYPGDK